MIRGQSRLRVEIVNYRVSSGLYSDRTPWIEAEMKMEGEVLYFCGDLALDKIKVYVEIGFKDKESIDPLFLRGDENDEDERNGSYIGHIRLSDEYESYDGKYKDMCVEIALSNNMFFYLHRFEGKAIKLSTNLDYLENGPTDDQKSDYGSDVIALITSVHFEVESVTASQK